MAKLRRPTLNDVPEPSFGAEALLIALLVPAVIVGAVFFAG